MCHFLEYPAGVSGQVQYLRESIIYDLKQVNGQPIQVETLDITGVVDCIPRRAVRDNAVLKYVDLVKDRKVNFGAERACSACKS
jgi:hypothetical protein